MRYFNNNAVNYPPTFEQHAVLNEKPRRHHGEATTLFSAIKSARTAQISVKTGSAAHWATGLWGLVIRLLFVGGHLAQARTTQGFPATGVVAMNNSIIELNTTSVPAIDLPYQNWPGFNADEGPDLNSPEAARAQERRLSRIQQSITNEIAWSLEPQNKNIADFINKRVALPGNSVSSSEGLKLVNRALGYLNAHPEKLPSIAYALLQGSGLYGASPGERLSINSMHKVVNDWVMANVFDNGVDDFVVRQMLSIRTLAAGETQPGELTVKSARERVLNRLALLAAEDLNPIRGEQASNKTINQYIHENILTPALPTLFFKGNSLNIDQMELGTLDWCYLHIGLTFAVKSTSDVSDMTKEEIVDMGCMLSALMMMGSLSAGLINLFNFPAFIYFLKQRQDENKTAWLVPDIHSLALKNEALSYFLAAGEAREEAINPFKQFGKLMHGYQTRTQLAKSFHVKHCGDVVKNFEIRIEAYKTNPEDFYCPPQKKYDVADIHLPDLNWAFEDQISKIGQKFAIVDRLLILDAIRNLPKGEQQFLAGAVVRRAGADFSLLDALTGLPAEYIVVGAKPAVQMKPGFELLVAIREKEERFFAIGNDESGYWFKRVDRQKENYFELMDKNIAGSDKYYRLNIYYGITESVVYKNSLQKVSIMADKLVAEHTKRLERELYNRGYEESSDEAFTRFMLSFIPFYHCAVWNPHRQEEAVMSCVMDGINLIPLAGQALSLSSRVALRAGQSGVLSARQALVNRAGALTMNAVGFGVRSFANAAMASLAQELDRKALMELLSGLARTLDPGLEMAGLLGRATVKQVSNAARLLSHENSVMGKLFLKLNKQSVTAHLPAGIKDFDVGRLPGIDHDMPILRLAGDRYQNHPVYVRVNPDTGDCFGKKYILRQNNLLEAIPDEFAVNIRNIQRYGLSGRGAGQAARVWNRQASIDAIASVDINGMEHAVHISRYGDASSEALLFPEQGITLMQEPLDLASYFNTMDALTRHQKSAMRRWIMSEPHQSFPSYAELAKGIKTIAPVSDRINNNLWRHIPIENWRVDERNVYIDLSRLLKRDIPVQKGDYVTGGQYEAGDNIPWADTIGTGDIVTNFPTFLSVRGHDSVLKQFTKLANDDVLAGLPPKQAMLYLKIEGGEGTVPIFTLEHGLDMAVREYLYPPNSLFRVKSISTAYIMEGEISPTQRIGVVLEEYEGLTSQAKNIYDGAIVKINGVEWG